MVSPAWPLVSGSALSRASGVACLVLACAGVLGCNSKAPTSTEPASEDRVFVSQAGSSTLLVVGGVSGKTLARIEVGMLPHNLVVSLDHRTLYAALVGSQAIAEIDAATLSLRRTLLTAPVPERRRISRSVGDARRLRHAELQLPPGPAGKR